MEDHKIQLGQKVQDRISKFTGIVTKAGTHITGCERFGVRPVGEEVTDHRGEEEFFHPQQLNILEEETDFSEEGRVGYVDHGFTIGERVRDDISGFEGVICVINYRLWNCPSFLVYATASTTDEEPETCWCDSSQVSSVEGRDVTHVNDSPNENPPENTGSMMDSAPSNNSR